MDLPNYFKSPTVMRTWMVVMKAILQHKLDPSLTKKPANLIEKENKTKHVFWQNKIWVSKILDKWISKHGSPKFVH